MPDAFESAVATFSGDRFIENIDTLLSLAATCGHVIISETQHIKSACGAYEVDDLLLPVDLATYETFAAAAQTGKNIFPDWFSAENGRVTWNQVELCRAFIQRHNVSKRNGLFFIGGNQVTDDEIKERLLQSISIVDQNPGRRIYDAFTALKTLCRDEQAQKAARQRLSIAALAQEMEKRKFSVRLNLISQEIEIRGKTDTGRDMLFRDLVTFLHDALQDVYRGVTFQTLENDIEFLARENSYNPVLELLEATKPDGKEHVSELFSLMHIDDDPLSKTLVSKWLLQACALLFNTESDPFSSEGVLVLIGSQHVGKTSLFRGFALQNKWFREGKNLNRFDKDTVRRVVTGWITELGEIGSTFSDFDLNSLKAFITCPRDDYRLPYGRNDVQSARRTSLCGTGNDMKYLIDETGNRRFWTVPLIQSIPYEEIMKFDFLQLWRQIYDIVALMTYKQKSECFRLSPTEYDALASRNRGHEMPLRGQEEINDILTEARENGYIFKMMTATQFKKEWETELRRLSAEDIGKVLSRLGFERKRNRQYELPTRMRAIENPFLKRESAV